MCTRTKPVDTFGMTEFKMHLEIPLGSDTDFIEVISDLVWSLQRLAEQHKISLGALGDLGMLADRVQAEVTGSNTVVSFVPLVGAWPGTPINASNSDNT